MTESTVYNPTKTSEDERTRAYQVMSVLPGMAFLVDPRTQASDVKGLIDALEVTGEMLQQQFDRLEEAQDELTALHAERNAARAFFGVK